MLVLFFLSNTFTKVENEAKFQNFQLGILKAARTVGHHGEFLLHDSKTSKSYFPKILSVKPRIIEP